jgi:Ca-activated chloride channel family protein
MRRALWLRGLVASCLLSAAAPAGTSDARKLISDGNAHFEAGRFSEARDAYASTPEPSEPALLADLLHNRAAAEFKLGNYAAARDIWVRAAGLLDAAFEAKANYNLGNCSYREGLELLESSQAPAAANSSGAAQPASVPSEQILTLLGRAIERYRDAIRLDPKLVDARANMELADQLRKKIKEQATSQPQSQPSSQPQSQPGSQPSDQQNGEGDQQSQSQPSSNPSKSDKSQSQPSEDEQQQENQDGQQDEQKQPESKPSQSQPASQPRPQPQPESQPESQPSEGDEEKEMKMSPSEFERLLQKVRDAERLRRQRLREAERSRQRPVDKDW